MGNMGGMAVCLELRLEESYGKLGHVPVLMLLDRRPDVFLARRSGAEGWVIKPLDPIRLRRAITALLDGGTYHDESYPPLPVVSTPVCRRLTARSEQAASRSCPSSDATKTKATAVEPGRPDGAVRRRPAAADGRSTGAGAGGGADAQEQFILDALHDLHDTAVREVMTPRVDVVALSIPLTAEAVTRAVRESGHSCFPVCGDNLDDLIGVLFVNDLFRAGWKVGGAEEWRRGVGRGDRAPGSEPATDAGQDVAPTPRPLDISRRLRQPFLVPESRLVLEVLAEMRRQHRAFAVVVDEHGGVEGVLTVKDLLGALVGDLPDEFDPGDEPEVVRVDARRWLVDGRMSVDDVRDRLDINLPEGEYVTLGGFLFDAFGHIPSEGEALAVDGWELRVTEMDKRRIAKVVAKRPEPPSGPEPRPAGEAGNERTTVG